jgi:hypothetical protein
MNILKLQDELKSVPDNALVGYVQNPSGQVPTYLALSELQRRKDMRAKAQVAQPSQTTVAQDLEQQAAPQQGIAAIQQPAQAPTAEQGVAGLPVPDQMFSGQGMAQGGIVAFAGDTDGSYVNPGLYGSEVKEYKNPYKSMKLFGEEYNLYGDGLLGPNPDQDTIRAFNHQRSMNPFLSGMPRTDLAEEYGILRNKAAENKATQKDYDRMNEINQSMKPAENYPTGGGATQASIAAMQQSDAAKAAKDAQEKALRDKEKALKDMAAANAASSKGTKQGIKSLADYAKEFRDVVGEDPLRAKLADRLTKMDEKAAKQEEQAPWMALAQAGFSIAGGKSPYALQNIAAGALEGVKSYGDAKDKMAALEDKRFALMADMDKAQRAEQLATASKGADSRDAALAREQQDRIHKETMANQLQLHILDNTYELKKTQIAAAAKDLPNAVDRATKIDPLVTDDKSYKEGLKALEGKYGDRSPEPGSPNYDKYQADVDTLYQKVYAKKIRNPLTTSSFGAAPITYTPGQGYH